MAFHKLCYRDIGLNSDEASALISAASNRVQEVSSIVGSFNATPDRIDDAILKNKDKIRTTGANASEMLSIVKIGSLSVSAFLPLLASNEIDESLSFYKKHESFGCVDNSSLTSSHPVFVGSPSMSSRIVAFNFCYGYLESSMGIGSDSFICESTKIASIHLADEQYAGLVRGIGSGSPCKIDTIAGSFVDMPPSMHSTESIAEDFSKRASQISLPLTNACSELIKMMKAMPKVSTKAEYAKVMGAIENIQKSVSDIKDPLNDLFDEAAGVIAEASINQVMMEISEPLLKLGLSGKKLLEKIQED